MPNLKENLNYPRRMVIYAIFDVLDRMNATYEQVSVGDIRAEVTIRGNTSRFAFAVTDLACATSVLHVAMIQSITNLTEEDKKMAVRYLMDCVLQHIKEIEQPSSLFGRN